jgi:hypothetical protein
MNSPLYRENILNKNNMLHIPKNIPVITEKNLIPRKRILGLHRKTPIEFELVFFENGKEKMVLAQGSAAFMKWTKNQLRKAPPYIHGLLMLRQKGALQLEAIMDKKYRNIRIPFSAQLPPVKMLN